jgi:hypothetical protein
VPSLSPTFGLPFESTGDGTPGTAPGTNAVSACDHRAFAEHEQVKIAG